MYCTIMGNKICLTVNIGVFGFRINFTGRIYEHHKVLGSSKVGCQSSDCYIHEFPTFCRNRDVNVFTFFTARQSVKKRAWETEEILAVERHLKSFITTCRVPGKRDCDKCLEQEKEALKNRDWLAVKFYVKNRITALKRKV